MGANDEQTLRQFACVLRIDSRYYDRPPEPKIKAAEKAIARCMLCVPLPEELAVSLPGHLHITDGSIPINLPLRFAIGAGYAAATANIAAFELLKQNHLLGRWMEMPYHLRSSPDSDWGFDDVGGGTLYLVRANASLKSLVIGSDRPCGPRDHLWLAWEREEGYGVSAIRDRWNELDNAERQSHSPKCFAVVRLKEKGRAVVKTGIAKAKEDLEKAGMSLNPRVSTDSAPPVGE